MATADPVAISSHPRFPKSSLLTLLLHFSFRAEMAVRQGLGAFPAPKKSDLRRFLAKGWIAIFRFISLQ
ncbi:MAG: hypothetical protein SOT14_11170, partial [Succinivibrio sp.]|nr:hypothetical protein [Succinivibrio sp.]